MATVTVRYIVDDVDASIDFYCRNLGFQELMHPAATFAMLVREDLRLALSAPSGRGGGGQPMPDGTPPSPGGWNRFSLEVSDLEASVDSLRRAGVRFRNDIVTGVGGRQILLEDPSGNPVELFEPIRPSSPFDRRILPPRIRERRGSQPTAATGSVPSRKPDGRTGWSGRRSGPPEL